MIGAFNSALFPRSELPPRNLACRGIYALIRGSEVVYIGYSQKIPMRLRQHGDKEYTHYQYREIPKGKAIRPIEQSYITKLRPQYNKNPDSVCHNTDPEPPLRSMSGADPYIQVRLWHPNATAIKARAVKSGRSVSEEANVMLWDYILSLKGAKKARK